MTLGRATSDRTPDLATRLDAVAAGLVAFPFGLVLVATAGFAVGVPLHPAVMLPAAILTLVVLRRTSVTWTETALTAAAVLVAHGVALLIALATLDPSYDGLWYHQEAVLRLAAGWNPIYEDPALYGSRDPEGGLLAGLAYAKAGWIMAAPVFQAVGRIEASKLFTLTLMLAVGCYTAATLLRWHVVGRRWALLLGGLAAFSPVAVYQSVTFYVDGLLACCLTMLCLGLTRGLVAPARWPSFVAAASACLLANLKYTGVVYLGFFLSVAILATRWTHGRAVAWRQAASWGLLVMLSIGGVGYAPYAINVLRHHNPFYPVATAGGFNQRIVSNNWPPDIAARNRVSRFLTVNFAEANGDYPPPATTAKFPLVVRSAEMSAWRIGDARIGGLGPLYGALLVAGLILVLACLAGGRQDPIQAACLIVACVLVASVFVHSEGWWARYAPQAWLVPLAVATGALRARPRLLRWGGSALVAMAALNSLLVIGGVAGSQVAYRAAVDASLREMASVGEVQVYMHRLMSLRRRLTEAGIMFRVSDARPGPDVVRHAIPSADPADSFWWTEGSR